MTLERSVSLTFRFVLKLLHVHNLPCLSLSTPLHCFAMLSSRAYLPYSIAIVNIEVNQYLPSNRFY